MTPFYNAWFIRFSGPYIFGLHLVSRYYRKPYEHACRIADRLTYPPGEDYEPNNLVIPLSEGEGD